MSNALFSGQCLDLIPVPGTSYLNLQVNLKKESVNKFNAETLGELSKVLEILKPVATQYKGLVISSGKDAFLAGADITEFLDHFKKSESELKDWIQIGQKLFSQIEDLPFPTVAVISGFALGGGLEFALTCDFRIALAGAKIGLPETKLGIIPGWGGTVRLPRLIGMDPAIEWITSGNQFDANEGLKLSVVDAVITTKEPQKDLPAAALQILNECNAEKLDWRARRKEKTSALSLNATEKTMGLTIMKAGVFAATGGNYPAPLAAIEAIEKSVASNREEAMNNEAAQFAKVAKTDVAKAMVGTFLADQAVKKKAKNLKSASKPVTQAAVLGAGIMGGGIAYQSAYSKIPIFMKDIRPEALQGGMKEAATLLDKQVQRGKLNALGMADTLSRIQPTLNQADIANANYVVEAVTENEKVKIAVLQETENTLKPDAFLTSNTSTISIDLLAKNLKRPEKFCGMHFFNPVPKMPLVEIIRGSKTSPETIATAVQYSLTMGKTPIVVNDCPGFLVNRILFAYFAGYNMLLQEGIDFVRVDKVMEKWGWPMGPAYLLDVVGIDTGHHAGEVMSKGFPDRMPLKPEYAITKMYKAGRFGQKNGKGFYNYAVDVKGKSKKEVAPEAYEILGNKPGAQTSHTGGSITDQEIIDRLMIPYIFESARCLQDKIAEEAIDIDIASLYGLGFPPFRGGPIRYADAVGLQNLMEKGMQFAAKLGPTYEVPEYFKEQAKKGAFYV